MSKRGVSRKAKHEYKPEIYEGLQLPAHTGEAKLKVRVVDVQPKLTNDEIKAREGSYFTDKEAD